ncbi:MAG: excinuclease ABC subunit UvrC [Aquificae bacterium]|nr:excinuclease ABC subunit UvrC [Aquificota bacterium]
MRALIEGAPEKPGVYLFKRGDEYVYVGKAKNIKKRLLQHLQASKKDPKERAIVNSSDKLEWIVTRNEYEALVLEVELIQRHKPRYNVLHKFGSGYPMLLLTNDEFPTVKVVRGTDHEGELYGPFLKARKAYGIKKLVHELFKLRTCDPMPERKEPCMDYHLGLCSAPCCGLTSREEYALAVEGARALLTGEVSEVLPKLYAKIDEYASRLMFEKCALIRDQITALENLARGQSVTGLPVKEADVFYAEGHRLYLFLVRAGKLVAKERFELETEHQAEEALLGYYYRVPPARLVVTNFPLSEEARAWITGRSDGEVRFTDELPEELKAIIRANVEQEADLKSLEKAFKEVLKIDLPRVIEAFDVSHFYGEDTVGSCVVWREGRLSKRDYRRYRVKTVDKIDDYAALEEILTRRARRIKEGSVEEPDAWLIDGGRGQLSVGIKVKRRFGLNLRVFSLAKEEEILYGEGGLEVRLKEHPLLYRVFGLLRDEAHRFALTYNRKLREKRQLRDVLKELGLGEVKRKIIYRNFPSLYEFIEADDEELRKLGLSPELRQKVKRYLESNEEGV